MVKGKELFQRRNQFSQTEIEEVSRFMFDAFTFQSENWQQSLEVRIAMLKGYIEVMRQLLFSDLVQHDAQKVVILDVLDKLIAQKELFELALADKETVKNLTAAAGQFQKKTQAAIGI